jgi:hypothetical protein
MSLTPLSHRGGEPVNHSPIVIILTARRNPQQTDGFSGLDSSPRRKELFNELIKIARARYSPRHVPPPAKVPSSKRSFCHPHSGSSYSRSPDATSWAQSIPNFFITAFVELFRNCEAKQSREVGLRTPVRGNFGVCCQEHVDPGSAEEGAIQTFETMAANRVNVAAARTESLDRGLTEHV